MQQSDFIDAVDEEDAYPYMEGWRRATFQSLMSRNFVDVKTGESRGGGALGSPWWVGTQTVGSW